MTEQAVHHYGKQDEKAFCYTCSTEQEFQAKVPLGPLAISHSPELSSVTLHLTHKESSL
jgi:hypothetical protein